MLYAIAKIVDMYTSKCEYNMVGFRVLDDLTGVTVDITMRDAEKGIRERSLSVENIGYRDGKIDILDEYGDRYNKVMEGKLIGSQSLVLLERLSPYEYKCSDYKGTIVTVDFDNMLICDLYESIANAKEVKAGRITIMEGLGEVSKIHNEKQKDLNKKIENYNMKSKLLGLSRINIECLMGEAIIVSADKNIKECIIPSFVTGIWQKAFEECDLRSIVIPKSVKFIGSNAFRGCEQLKEVDMSECGLNMYRGVFSGCKRLLEIKLPSGLKVIPEDSFLCCSKLKRIDIPYSIIDIGRGSFAYCTSLETLELKNDIRSIDTAAFYGCSGLEHIKLKKVDEIGTGVFMYCTGLKEMDISKLQVIGDKMFSECNSLVSVTVPESVTKIGNRAFYDCKSLETLKLHNGIKDIGKNIVNECCLLDGYKLK